MGRILKGNLENMNVEPKKVLVNIWSDCAGMATEALAMKELSFGCILPSE